MNRPLRIAILSLTISLALVAAHNASATTYYVAANGNDANNGTATSTPWQHAPGMGSCTSNCLNKANGSGGYSAPSGGDSFIFRGGDTWYIPPSAATPNTGGWAFSWSGTSANCQVNPQAGAIQTSSCIYIGVDKTYYSGSSWSRPILSGDNPLTNGNPSSCTYEDDGGFLYDTGSYQVLDNFEFTGLCWNNRSPGAGQNYFTGTMIDVSNLYAHGWTMGNNSYDDFPVIAGVTYQPQYMIVTGMVCDGSDSTFGNLEGSVASGDCITAGPSEVSKSYFTHVANVCNCSTVTSFHDNTVHDVFFNDDAGMSHSNVFQIGVPAGASVGYGTIYFYNNLIYNTNLGENVQISPGVGANAYIFNNVFYGINHGNNCLTLYGNSSVGVSNYYIYNNTFDSSYNPSWSNAQGCQIYFQSNYAGGTGKINGTAYFRNNHFISFGATTPPINAVYFSTGTATSQTVTDNGNELFQSEATANGQGYTPGSHYAPTSSSGKTIGAAANIASSCSTFSPDSALCSGTSGGVSEQPASGGQIAVDLGVVSRNSPLGCIPLLSILGCWDVGAYMYGSGIALQPSAPFGLQASVQ
jgi:hypothetical protein